MYIAEFAFIGTTELADELLIQTSSEATAQEMAQHHANKLGVELFSLTLATDQRMSEKF